MTTPKFKKFTIFYLIFIVAGVLLLSLQPKPIYVDGLLYGMVMPSLGIFYGINRNWQTTTIDKLMYSIFVLEFISDILSFLKFGEIGLVAQIVVQIAVYFLLFDIFRVEGTYVIFTNKRDILKIIVPFCFVGYSFGSIALQADNPDDLYISVLLFTAAEFILILFASFRKANIQSKIILLIGGYIKIITDIVYGIVFLLNYREGVYQYIMFFTYTISQYLIIVGILLNNNESCGILSKRLQNIIYLFNKNKPH